MNIPSYSRGGVVTAISVAAVTAFLIGLWAGSFNTASGRDWPAWVQAIGTIIAVVAAITVPTRIHLNEQKEARRQRGSYKNLLRSAFISFRDAVSQVQQIRLGMGNGVAWIPGPDVAQQLSDALRTMRNLSAVLNEIHDIKRLDDFEVILPLLDFRKKLEGAKDDFEREAGWLQEHPNSINVVASAVNTLGHRAEELRPDIDRIISVLETG
jgi:hypothetical protein